MMSLGIAQLGVVALLNLALASQLAETKSVAKQSWQRVPELPEQFRGRWALVDSSGKITPEACQKLGVKSADLFVGPSWFIHQTGQGYLTKVELLGSESARYEVVDNGGGEIGVTVELMNLSKGNAELEIASNPDIGWDIARYRRCA